MAHRRPLTTDAEKEELRPPRNKCTPKSVQVPNYHAGPNNNNSSTPQQLSSTRTQTHVCDAPFSPPKTIACSLPSSKHAVSDASFPRAVVIVSHLLSLRKGPVRPCMEYTSVLYRQCDRYSKSVLHLIARPAKRVVESMVLPQHTPRQGVWPLAQPLHVSLEGTSLSVRRRIKPRVVKCRPKLNEGKGKNGEKWRKKKIKKQGKK